MPTYNRPTPGSKVDGREPTGHHRAGCGSHRGQLESANLSGADLRFATLQSVELRDANLRGAILYSTDLSTTMNLTREQILSTRGWSGASLPTDMKDLELPEDAPEDEMDRLGRTWKLEKRSE